MKLIIFLLMTLAAYGQITINAGAVSVNADGEKAFLLAMSREINNVSTALAADITAGATTLTVEQANYSGPAQGLILIDGEMIQLVSVAGNVLTVTRGANGTTPAAHSQGAAIVGLRFRTINAFAKEVIVRFVKKETRNYAAINAAVNAAITARDAAVEAAAQ